MKIKITNFDQLKEGKEYSIYCKQFDVDNKAVMVSNDFTGMNRRIAYFQFSDMGENRITKRQFIREAQNNISSAATFALWEHDLQHNTISEIK